MQHDDGTYSNDSECGYGTLKILHAIHSLDSYGGGPVAVIRGLVPAQLGRDHRVTVLSTTTQLKPEWEPDDRYRAAIHADKALSGAEICLARAYGRRPPWSTYGYTPGGRHWLMRRLLDPAHRPDIVHIHGVFSHVTGLAARLCRRVGIPYVIRPAGTFNPKCMDHGRRRLKQLVTRLTLQNDLRGAALLHATSAMEADFLTAWVSEEKIRVLPLGVDVPEYDRVGRATLLYQRYPQLRGQRVVLYLSRIAAKKRPEWLPAMLSRLPADCDDVAILFVGHGDEHLAVVQEAARLHVVENRVVFAGHLDGQLKEAAFAAANVFVLPSIDENFGVAVIEALAHGVPAVVTQGVASHRYIDRSRCGQTVGDSLQEVTDAVARVLNGTTHETGELGRRYVREQLSWARAAARFDEMYAECCGRACETSGTPLVA